MHLVQDFFGGLSPLKYRTNLFSIPCCYHETLDNVQFNICLPNKFWSGLATLSGNIQKYKKQWRQPLLLFLSLFRPGIKVGRLSLKVLKKQQTSNFIGPFPKILKFSRNHVVFLIFFLHSYWFLYQFWLFYSTVFHRKTGNPRYGESKMPAIRK